MSSAKSTHKSTVFCFGKYLVIIDIPFSIVIQKEPLAAHPQLNHHLFQTLRLLHSTRKTVNRVAIMGRAKHKNRPNLWKAVLNPSGLYRCWHSCWLLQSSFYLPHFETQNGGEIIPLHKRFLLLVVSTPFPNFAEIRGRQGGVIQSYPPQHQPTGDTPRNKKSTLHYWKVLHHLRFIPTGPSSAGTYPLRGLPSARALPTSSPLWGYTSISYACITGRNLHPHRPPCGDTPAFPMPASPAGIYTRIYDSVRSGEVKVVV